jgi:hypothetical protein
MRRFKIRTVDDMRRFCTLNGITEIADRPGEIWFARSDGEKSVVYTRQCPVCDERLLKDKPCWRCGPKCADCGELLILNNCWECNPNPSSAGSS